MSKHVWGGRPPREIAHISSCCCRVCSWRPDSLSPCAVPSPIGASTRRGSHAEGPRLGCPLKLIMNFRHGEPTAGPPVLHAPRTLARTITHLAVDLSRRYRFFLYSRHLAKGTCNPSGTTGDSRYLTYPAKTRLSISRKAMSSTSRLRMHANLRVNIEPQHFHDRQLVTSRAASLAAVAWVKLS